MADVHFSPFGPQKEFLLDDSRIRCLFAAKRSGKSEPAYIDTIMKCEQQPNYVDNGIDPYMAAIVAPTNDMLHTLVWPKFNAFAAPFKKEFIKSVGGTFWWNSNNSIIHGVTAEKIKRLEGKKINHIHITEAFQVNENVLLECLARLSDTLGSLTIDGSLGPNIPAPKSHWLYKQFKEKEFEGARIWEWKTADNPYFPKAELERFKRTLDPTTYRALFELDWDTVPSNAVYSNFTDDNLVRGYKYNPEFECYVSIDWGYGHPAAVGFFNYDYAHDRVYQFDEIVESRLQLDTLYSKIRAKISLHNMKVDDWICDIAGNQTREQTGKSNIKHFKDKYGIHFKKRRTAIVYGIPLVRSYIKSATGNIRYYVDEIKCPKTVDGIKRYHYKEVDGCIVNENPVDIENDAVDMARYFFINILDPTKMNKQPATTIYRTA